MCTYHFPSRDCCLTVTPIRGYLLFRFSHFLDSADLAVFLSVLLEIFSLMTIRPELLPVLRRTKLLIALPPDCDLITGLKGACFVDRAANRDRLQIFTQCFGGETDVIHFKNELAGNQPNPT